MDPDAKPDPLAVRHRPLPSVNVALLPHELRAARTRTLALVLVGLLAAGITFAISAGRNGWFHQEDSASDADKTADEQPTTSLPPAAEVAMRAPDAPALQAPASAEDTYGNTKVVRKFGEARGFRDALQSAGASAQESAELVTALEKVVDFRHCQPGHELMFERDAEGELTAFEYRVSLTDVYRAAPDSRGKMVGSRVDIPIEVRRIARGGYISGSLGQALDALGLGRSLAGVFVESFEGKVDFKKDTRAGDSFRILVDEEYVHGQLLRYGTVQAVEYHGERVGTVRAFWFQPNQGKGDYFDSSGVSMHGGWLRTPLRYDHISSGYNPRRRHPILKRIMPHNGVDYAAAPGTSVWAAADGKVLFAGQSGANGNLISLRHAGGYETFYAHLLRIGSGIRAGVTVTQRQAIGAVGSTGRSTGPHLHFALKRNGRFVDPASQLNGPGRPLPSGLMAAFKARARELERDLEAISLAAAPVGDDPESSGDEEFHDEGDLP